MILLTSLSFFGWYPKVWSEIRGRQHPLESPINITKSPKWRNLFYYNTYLYDSKNTDIVLKENVDHISKNIIHLENKLKFLERDIKRIIQIKAKKHYKK